jgi:hypothetical protein
MQFRHEIEIHTINACDQSRWQEYYGDYREDLDGPILFNIDEAQGRIHKKVNFFEQESAMRQQGIDVPQNLAYLSNLLIIQVTSAQKKCEGSLRVHQAQAHLPIMVLLSR